MIFQLKEKGGLPISFVFEGEDLDLENYKWAKDHLDFTGKVGDLAYFPSIGNKGQILVGLGKKEELDIDTIRLVFFKLGNLARSKKEMALEIVMPDLGLCHRRTLMAAYEGICQGEYSFARKEEKKKPELTINYSPFKGDEEKLKSGLKRIQSQMEGVFLARDLVNETANRMYPEVLAQKAKDSLEDLGVKVTVFNREQLEEMGLKAFLAVGQGSDKEAKLILMEYTGDPSSQYKTGLVGKGLTYDSGGYCIKSPSGMVTMHSDMGGAGSVIGAIYALAKTKAKANVVGVVAACENLISGKAYKTGDILESLSGKTIEVVNTDAEGRITLADAVYYTSKELKVDRIIDLATLTGAVLVALGEEYTGAITNNAEFLSEFKNSADQAGEKVWELPNDKNFKDKYKSKVADFKNSAGRDAGTVTAGQFVGEFVANDIPWIHLDIAGTAYLSKAQGYLPERATGVHVKALHNLLDPTGKHK